MGAEHLSELMPLRISTLCSPAPETFLTPPSTTPRRKPAGVDRGEWGGDARGSPPFCTQVRGLHRRSLQDNLPATPSPERHPGSHGQVK